MSDDATPVDGSPSAAADDVLAELNRSPRIDRLNELPPTGHRVAMRRLAAATRRVIDLMSSTTASAADLEDAAVRLEALGDALAEMPSGSHYEGYAEAANAGNALADRQRLYETGDPEAWAQFDFSPFIGLANPMSPPMVLRHEDARIVADVTFGAAYEGPPSCVHGGYVAAAFDEVLGAAQSLSGTQGMTASLKVDYRSPTPLHQPLQITAWLERRDGRKIWVRGAMVVGDRLTAEAEGLFIAFDAAKFLALLEARSGMAGGGDQPSAGLT